MCGIFLFNDTGDSEANCDDVRRAFGLGSGRGPETSTLKYDSRISSWIGFHRLAINGLTKGSDQPFYIKDCILVCNGEIYNHSELALSMGCEVETESDCEIIIHMYRRYGMKHTLTMLDGVFSFILVDLLSSKVYVARDPFGVRPLYFSRPRFVVNNYGKRHVTCIASEFGQVTSAVTSEYDVEQFPPGCYVTLKIAAQDTLSTFYVVPDEFERYYMLPPTPVICDSDDGVLVGLAESLRCAVAKRVRNTERPVGCLLSGGLDSSVIAALVMKEKQSPINTYSIGMAGSEDLKYAAMVAKHIGSNHKEVILSEEAFFHSIPQVIERISSFDTTTVRASVGNYLIGLAISAGSSDKVIFNGDGADEVMGGYLYIGQAPDALEFDKECRRLVNDIHFFDVLRSDRSISTHGLETRTPFLDKGFVNDYFRISAQHRFVTTCDHGEKYLLRKAIETAYPDLLPKEVLWRRKEAFSDGVSGENKSWFQVIRERLAAAMSAENATQLSEAQSTYQHLPPETLEQLHYRNVFDKAYPNRAAIVPYFWMPKYVNAHDSSARTLELYKKP